MEIELKRVETISTNLIIELYKDAAFERPVSDADRIAGMYAHSNLIITAWDGEKLVGVSRALTDFCWCCYLSDLVVRTEYQQYGIGKKLIAFTKKEIGEETMLLLLSTPSAMEYYPRLGFEPVDNGFIVKRTK